MFTLTARSGRRLSLPRWIRDRGWGLGLGIGDWEVGGWRLEVQKTPISACANLQLFALGPRQGSAGLACAKCDR